MKKILCIIFAICSLFLASCASKTIYLDKIYVESTPDVSQNIQQIYDDYSHSVANVSLGMIYATGTCVEKNENGAYFVTANVFGTINTAVTLYDNDHIKYQGRITAIDSKNSLAMVLVSSENSFKAIRFSEVSYLKGDHAVILSSDENANVLVNKGYISYINSYSIATDASTNNTSLGAPIFDILGNCLGILYSEETTIDENEYAIGIGYAFNATLSAKICSDLLDGGNISRPSLGVSTYFVNQKLADDIGLNVTLPDSDNYYIFIDSVTPASNAYYAGIRAGDIIYKANDYIIDSNNYLPALLRTARLGDTLNLEIIRSNNHINISVTFRFA